MAASTSASTRKPAPGSDARSASTCIGIRCGAAGMTRLEANAAEFASPGRARQSTAMRQEYGQFCPVALASEVLAERWTLLVVRELLAGARRFNEIRRGVPRVSATLLKQRLDTLEHAGIVERKASDENGGPEYCLTESGQSLRPVLVSIGE